MNFIFWVWLFILLLVAYFIFVTLYIIIRGDTPGDEFEFHTGMKEKKP